MPDMPSTKKNFLQSVAKIFTHHPESIGETYVEHFCFASFCGIKLTLAGIACVLHSIFPFVFINTASNTIENVKQEISDRKNHVNR